MNEQQFLSFLTTSHDSALAAGPLALAMIVAFVLALPVVALYRLIQRTQNFSVGFLHVMLMFASLSSAMTMLIGNNIARAFGLVGALSIIRFRNALKSPVDAVFIFWTLALGMACGMGAYVGALTITVVGGFLGLILHLSNYGIAASQESILRIFVPMDSGPEVERHVEQIFRQDGWKFRQMNVIVHSEENRKALVYHVTGNKKRDVSLTFRKMHDVTGVQNVHLANTAPTIFAA